MEKKTIDWYIGKKIVWTTDYNDGMNVYKLHDGTEVQGSDIFIADTIEPLGMVDGRGNPKNWDKFEKEMVLSEEGVRWVTLEYAEKYLIKEKN
tara:strand:- start:312 stop:590 length:279 start_codon:yes stop_codon:yes gene_type:complete